MSESGGRRRRELGATCLLVVESVNGREIREAGSNSGQDAAEAVATDEGMPERADDFGPPHASEASAAAVTFGA